jgi:NADH:ubiquinone oxidoreductase subunit 3 (subunit A)
MAEEAAQVRTGLKFKRKREMDVSICLWFVGILMIALSFDKKVAFLFAWAVLTCPWVWR